MGQYRRYHLRSHCDLYETFHPSSVPQNFCAFQKGEPTSKYRDSCLYLELSDILPSEHPLLDLHMHSPQEDMESSNDHWSLL